MDSKPAETSAIFALHAPHALSLRKPSTFTIRSRVDFINYFLLSSAPFFDAIPFQM